jgi:hypothetical protein
MVGEISWSSVQSFNLRNPQLLRLIVEIEIRTLPQAVKETVILLTPAGALPLVVMLALLLPQPRRYESETAFCQHRIAQHAQFGGGFIACWTLTAAMSYRSHRC